MPIMEIVLLIAGAAVFTVSFFVPDRKGTNGNSKVDKKAIDDAVMESVGNVRGRLEAVVDEAISYAIEKSERSMDRLTNEKMSAVNEYADTVLESINKNHQEVMFLYDMVNNKSVELKNAVREAQQAQSGVQSGLDRIAKAAQSGLAQETEDDKAMRESQADLSAKVMSIMREESSTSDLQGGEADDIKPLAENLEVIKVSRKAPADETKPVSAIEMLKGTSKKKQGRNTMAPAASGRVPSLDLSADTGRDSGKNKNEKILKLHRMGKSNVEVARELGLGMGEVKLVIDLFEGSK